MPVRDGGPHLAEAVDSILAQSERDLELLVVDDHSRDGAVAALSRNDPRLTVIASEGRGVSAAFNTGFDRSRGDYIARMDADDIALPGRLTLQAACLVVDEAHRQRLDDAPGDLVLHVEDVGQRTVEAFRPHVRVRGGVGRQWPGRQPEQGYSESG